jgi:hypothetical protein
MKNLKTSDLPINLLFFDTETKGEVNRKNPSESFHRLWFGFVEAYYLRSDVISKYDCTYFCSSDQFWKFLKSRLTKKSPLYVFAHNLPFDLTIVDFWHETEQEDYALNFAILEDPPTILSLKHCDRKVVFLDTLNYWRQSLAQLGESLKMPKLTMPSYDAKFEKWELYCRNDTQIISKAIRELFAYITINDLGGFGMTAPSQAMRAFKRRFLKHQIFIHDNEKVLEMERESYYGGLVHNYYVGKIEDQSIYHFDVNSLYPAMMMHMFPVKYVFKEKTPLLKQLADNLMNFGACARVLIQSQTRPYPVRWSGEQLPKNVLFEEPQELLFANRRGKLNETVGTYVTTLAGPELMDGLQMGDVKHVFEICYYEMKPIFIDYVDFFWEERKKAKKEGNYVKDQFAKLLLNSLYGKFGQNAFEWIDLNLENLRLWYRLNGLDFPKEYSESNCIPSIQYGERDWYPKDSNTPIRLKWIGPVVQMRMPLGEHYESSPIVAAYVTSYGRSYMRYLRNLAGIGNVYYIDTDSLFVNVNGRNRLQRSGMLSDTKLGFLKQEGIYNKMEFNGPKDYVTPKEVKLKGIRKDAIPIGDNEFMQNQFEGLKSIMSRDPQPFITIKWITKQLQRHFTKGTIKKSGWTNYLTLYQNFDHLV